MKWITGLLETYASAAARDRLLGGTFQGIISAGAALIAYLPSSPLGLREGYWGSITAIAVVQTQLRDTEALARDQFAGAAIGSSVGALTLILLGQDLLDYALAIVVSAALCWLLNVASAARIAGATATIILLVPHRSTVVWMMISRIAEVGWGVTVAILTVWLVNRAKSTSILPRYPYD